MVEFNPTKLNRTDIVPVKHNSWGWDWVMLLDIFLNKVQSTIEQVIHSGHRKGEKEILSAASGPGVSISRQFLDGWAQRQCPPCSGEGLAVLPGLRMSFPALLFTVHLASPPDGNLKTTHRSPRRTPHPCTFFHRGFLSLPRCDFLAGPGEER